MISAIPSFRPGVEYLDGGKYRFETMESTAVRLDLPLTEVISFRDKDGREWMRLTGPKLSIRHGYAFDGCSPKAFIGRLWIGTPDPPCTRLASLVHDALYQMIATEHFPLSREQCDAAFFDIMRLSGFRFAGVYHQAVRTFGGFYARNNARNGCRSVVIHPNHVPR